jgi:hypothetical protein
VALIVAHFDRTIWSRSCGKSQSLKGTRSASDDSAECGACVSRDRCSLSDVRGAHEHDCDERADHHAIDPRSVLGTVQGSPLRSDRAARGLRALTVPARRSGPGHCVMVGVVMMRSWTDVDRLTAASSGVNLSSTPVLTAHPPREEHSARSAERPPPSGPRPTAHFLTSARSESRSHSVPFRDQRLATACGIALRACRRAVLHRSVAVSPGHS